MTVQGQTGDTWFRPHLGVQFPLTDCLHICLNPGTLPTSQEAPNAEFRPKP